MKLGYVLAFSNLSLDKKICDCMLDTFYKGTSNFLIFVFMYVPFSVSLCDNNVLTRMSSIMA